jgi:hypothetical protein
MPVGHELGDLGQNCSFEGCADLQIEVGPIESRHLLWGRFIGGRGRSRWEENFDRDQVSGELFDDKCLRRDAGKDRL